MIKFIFLLLFVISSSISASEKKDDVLLQAEKLVSNGNIQEAIDLLIPYSKKIDDESAEKIQLELSYLFWTQLEDYENAAYWAEICAIRGNVDCQYNLAAIFEEYLVDHEKSAYWYHKCAENNDVICQGVLGYFYDNGLIGLEKNSKIALKWHLLAAEQNLSNSLTTIASYYLDGVVLEQSYKKAFDYYHRGAESNFGNSERAIYGLALMYEKGLGTKVNYNEAKKLYIKADEGGHEYALYRKDALEGDVTKALLLASLYKTGSEIDLGLPIDYEEAAFFYKIAEYKGSSDASGFDELIELMRLNEDDGYRLQWDRAAERFEIWKLNLGFDDQDTLNDITQYFLNHTGTASYINQNFLITNKHVTHLDDNNIKKCKKIIGYDPYKNIYEEYEIYNTEYLPKSLDIDLIYNPKGIDVNEISIYNGRPKLGEDIIAIGFPQGDYLSKYPKVTSGLVASDFGYNNNPDEFMTDATSYQGSSGSPIFNKSDQLIGILYGGPNHLLANFDDSGITDPNLAFVVQSKYIIDFLKNNEIKFSEINKNKYFQTYEIVENNINRIRFIECYDKFE